MPPSLPSQPMLKRRLLVDRSSNINLSTRTPATTVPAVPLHFPNEIILAVLALLAFDDLKSTRLLSKTWCSCASIFLFANISVSPNKEDLEVFKAITEHPLLSKCVRRLWYGGSEFLLDLSKRQYLNQLWNQRSWMYTVYPDHTSLDLLDSSDMEIKSWVRHVIRSTMGCADTMAKSSNAKFVNDGYQKYHEHAIYQHKCLQEGEFFARLVHGLERLDFLRAVTLECNWGPVNEPFEPRKGSHLARNWSIFHCSPQSWDWGARIDLRIDRDYLGKFSEGAEHYRILISALAQAQRRIRVFQTGPNFESAIPPYVFDRSRKTRSAQPLKFHDDNITAFSVVEKLTLRFSAYGQAKTCELFENISGFPAILGSMDHLKGLDLCLPNAIYEDSPIYYTYDQVFPKNIRWDNMKVLRLFQISIGATDLLLLLLDTMPGLRYLTMGEIILSQGSWEGVLEALKQMHRLRGFRLSCVTCLCHHEDREIWKDLSHCGELYYELNLYVMYGGRHPCLRSGLPDLAAKEYTRDLEPELRHRLSDLDSSSSEVENSA